MNTWYGILLLFILVGVAVYWRPQQPYILPKIVWTHWDTNNLPELCRVNLERTRRILHDWDVRFFTTADFLRWCLPPQGFDVLSIQHKADFARLWLLKNYGGVWMDISIVLNQSLNALYDECVSSEAELSGFYIEETTTDPKYPVFENWFIMAPQKSRIIQLWFDEFSHACRIGFKKYKQNARDSGLHFHNLLKDDADTYLTQHLCFQKVIQHRIWSPPHIIYRKAEDTMFRVHAKCDWEGRCMKATFNSHDIDDIPYIKLRGGDRVLFPINRLNVMPVMKYTTPQ